ELRGAAAEFANTVVHRSAREAKILLRLRQSVLFHQQGAAIALDAAQYRVGAGDRVIAGVELRTKSTRKSPLSSRVVRTEVIDRHATDATTEFEGVHALLNLREVVQLPIASRIDRVSDLRAVCASR